MSAFDNSAYEIARQQYEDEAKQRWGDTAAYKEYQQRGAADDAADGLMAIFGDFAACKEAGHPADSTEAHNLVKGLQEYISAHFYTCTNEILAGLGHMYVGDRRFRDNIDRHGEGTAVYAATAIQSYCEK